MSKFLKFYFYISQLFGDKDVPGDELHEILKEIDTNMNGQVELDEYLQVCFSRVDLHSLSETINLLLNRKRGLLQFIECIFLSSFLI